MIVKQRLTQIECLIGKRGNVIKTILTYLKISHFRSITICHNELKCRVCSKTHFRSLNPQKCWLQY